LGNTEQRVGDKEMFSERMPNWAKMTDFLTSALKTISTNATIKTSALRSKKTFQRSHETSIHEMNLETQRARAVANLRLVNVNR